jgi:hypothetical protein
VMVTISPADASATTADAFCFSARTPTVFMCYMVAHEDAGRTSIRGGGSRR